MSAAKKIIKKSSKEEVSDMKKETLKNSVQKGYNEKNPTQPEGAFKPDSKK